MFYFQFICIKIIFESFHGCLFRLQTFIVVLSFCSLATAGYLNGGGAVDYESYAHSAPIQEYSPVQDVYEAPIHHQQYESIQHIEPVHHEHYEHLPFVHSAPVHQQYETSHHIEPVHHHVEHVPIVHAAPIHEHVEAIQHIEPIHHHVETHVEHIPLVHQYAAPAALPVVHSAPQVIKIYQDVPHHQHNEVTRILRIRYNNDKKEQSFSPLSLLQRLFSS